MHVVLVQPEIAPNTGNIIRLCANTGCDLHLVEPLGFTLDDRLLKRGGLDYHEHASMALHATVAAAGAALPGRWLGFSSAASRSYVDHSFEPDDVLVFGSERSGLDSDTMTMIAEENRLSIPMRPDSRSLNLANAVSVVVYEAWRQLGFAGAGRVGASTSEIPGADPFDR